MSHGSSRPFSRKHSLDASLSDSREASTSLPAESGSMLVNIPRTTDVMAVVGTEIVRERRWRATGPAELQYLRGTVHRKRVARARERRLGFWAPETPAAGLRPRPARGKGFPSNLLFD